MKRTETESFGRVVGAAGFAEALAIRTTYDDGHVSADSEQSEMEAGQGELVLSLSSSKVSNRTTSVGRTRPRMRQMTMSLRGDPQIIAAVWTHLPGEMPKRMMDDIVAYLVTLEPGGQSVRFAFETTVCLRRPRRLRWPARPPESQIRARSTAARPCIVTERERRRGSLRGGS